MKKILMRAPVSPFENPDPVRAVLDDLVSTNAGNLLFPHSLTRTLMVPGTDVVFDKTAKRPTDEELEQINAACSAFVIPLANGFRKTFADSLRRLTDMVNHLTIPCVVAGVCIGAEIDEFGNAKLQDAYPFDDDAREFCRAILKKSAMIGVRGEVTATYMEHLGFAREKDFTVIGCPSMFLYGPDLPAPKELHLSPELKVNLNGRINVPAQVQRFLQRVCRDYPDHMYIPQNTYEIATVFAGRDIMDGCPFRRLTEPFPMDYSSPLYRENKVRAFVNFPAWQAFLRERDMNVGTRIHGNIAGVLSGIPVFILASDSRVTELSNYHHIPHMSAPALTDEQDLRSVTEKVDFRSVLDGHRERFDHYIDFLHANGLDTIYDTDLTDIPFDRRMSGITFEGALKPFPFAGYERQMQAMEFWNRYVARIRSADEARIRRTEEKSEERARKSEERIARIEERIARIEKRSAERQARNVELKKQNEELQRKYSRTARGVAERVAGHLRGGADESGAQTK